tara:strand:+ start:1604 stop:1861 length:258 start_codon:yes stop_codon:yes gene_type:complete
MDVSVELLTKKNCFLCEEAKEVIDEILSEFPKAQLKITDIESDPVLVMKYKEKIPVVFLNDEESFFYKVHPVTLRKKIEKILSQT